MLNLGKTVLVVVVGGDGGIHPSDLRCCVYAFNVVTEKKKK